MAVKRGRKRVNDLYFGPEEEEAVLRFLESTDEAEKNQIFNEYLIYPLDKMIESIIRRYRLYRKVESYEDLHTDTLSFLMTKIHKFEGSRGKKAYSYFGTIVKHYIIGLLQKDEKMIKKVASYEDVSGEIENREDLSYSLENDVTPMDLFFKKIIDGVILELDDEDLPPKKKLNENERKVGLALVEILDNWETIFDSLNGGSKYNKNSVLNTLREYTNLTTKDIRIAMKRFLKVYKGIKLLEL